MSEGRNLNTRSQGLHSHIQIKHKSKKENKRREQKTIGPGKRKSKIKKGEPAYENPANAGPREGQYTQHYHCFHDSNNVHQNDKETTL